MVAKWETLFNILYHIQAHIQSDHLVKLIYITTIDWINLSRQNNHFMIQISCMQKLSICGSCYQYKHWGVITVTESSLVKTHKPDCLMTSGNVTLRPCPLVYRYNISENVVFNPFLLGKKNPIRTKSIFESISLHTVQVSMPSS